MMLLAFSHACEFRAISSAILKSPKSDRFNNYISIIINEGEKINSNPNTAKITTPHIGYRCDTLYHEAAPRCSMSQDCQPIETNITCGKHVVGSATNVMIFSHEYLTSHLNDLKLSCVAKSHKNQQEEATQN
jgi:hypothetical protein